MLTAESFIYAGSVFWRNLKPFATVLSTEKKQVIAVVGGYLNDKKIGVELMWCGVKESKIAEEAEEFELSNALQELNKKGIYTLFGV